MIWDQLVENLSMQLSTLFSRINFNLLLRENLPYITWIKLIECLAEWYRSPRDTCERFDPSVGETIFDIHACLKFGCIYPCDWNDYENFAIHGLKCRKRTYTYIGTFLTQTYTNKSLFVHRPRAWRRWCTRWRTTGHLSLSGSSNSALMSAPEIMWVIATAILFCSDSLENDEWIKRVSRPVQ